MSGWETDGDGITAEDAIALVERFLPPGFVAASIEDGEFILRWRAQPRGSRLHVVRSATSFDDAFHNLIEECAPEFFIRARSRRTRDRVYRVSS